MDGERGTGESQKSPLPLTSERSSPAAMVTLSRDNARRSLRVPPTPRAPHPAPPHALLTLAAAIAQPGRASDHLYPFPGAAVTNSPKLGGLKQRQVIFSQLWRRRVYVFPFCVSTCRDPPRLRGGETEAERSEVACPHSHNGKTFRKRHLFSCRIGHSA